MINKTLRKANSIASSDAALSSDLYFQFDFEDATLLFVPEEVKMSFFHRLKAKWWDYRNELGLVLVAYCVIFTMIAFLGSNLLGTGAPIKNSGLSVAPLAAISNLYVHFDREERTKLSEKDKDLGARQKVSLATPAEEKVAKVNPTIQFIDEESTFESPIHSTSEEKTERPIASSKASNKGIDIISEDYQQLIRQISGEGRYALLKFGAKWCMPCQIMEETVFQDEQVKEYLSKHFRSMQVDVDHFDGYNLKQYYTVSAIPTFVILNAAGKEIGRYNKAMSTTEMREILSMYQHSSFAQRADDN